MLPFGHIAVGYLATQVLLRLTGANFSAHETSQLLLIGTTIGFIPDLDMFYTFAKVKKFFITDIDKDDHRKYLSHIPLVWLALGFIIYFFGTNPFTKYVGLLLWLCSWSHFIFDSLGHGIMWLWPFSTRLIALDNRKFEEDKYPRNFFGYWLSFIDEYITKASMIFALEILFVLTALATFWLNR